MSEKQSQHPHDEVDVVHPPDDEKSMGVNKTAAGGVPPRLRKLHDPDVSYHEYKHYAELTREDQASLPKAEAGKNILAYLIPNLQRVEQEVFHVPQVNLSDPSQRFHISDEEWVNASRAVRIATSGVVFYLITTDIFGPFGLPYAFATMGWAPGVVLYTVFAVMAGYSGYLLWDCFMGLDSYQFPIQSFGDLGFRIYGPWCRYLINILQAVQLVCNVGAIIISNGLALSEASQRNLCYAICCLVWALCGFFFGQIRSLQRFAWFANCAVFINLLVMFVTMGGAAHSPPDYSNAVSSAGATFSDLANKIEHGIYPPIKHSVGLPTSKMSSSLNGAMQAVYSFGGNMIFPEFMAEIRRPNDFLKGMWGAQLFIYLCYMLYGLYMYGFQGQYVHTPAYLGISAYDVQTAGNSLAMVAALIAATLYGNIGAKVIYNNILVELFRAPPLSIRSGKLLWVAVIPVYWGIAYVIGAAIPDFAGFTGIVAAVCILNFTYTFPPLLHFGFAVMRNASRSEPGFDPATGQVTTDDRGIKRLIRGFFGRRWYVNVFNVLYFLAALALCGLGTWASVETLIEAYSKPQFNAFSCLAPAQH